MSQAESAAPGGPGQGADTSLNGRVRGRAGRPRPRHSLCSRALALRQLRDVPGLQLVCKRDSHGLTSRPTRRTEADCDRSSQPGTLARDDGGCWWAEATRRTLSTIHGMLRADNAREASPGAPPVVQTPMALGTQMPEPAGRGGQEGPERQRQAAQDGCSSGHWPACRDMHSPLV